MAPPPKAPPTSKSPNSGETVARNGAIERILALFCAAYDREPPDEAELHIKVGVWALALGHVPVSELLPLARRELAERESSFFPAPADLVRRWNARFRLTPEGAANAAAYMPYQPEPVRPALREALPPLQIEPAELKRRLGMVAKRPPLAPEDEAKTMPQNGQEWSPLLIEVARAGHIALEQCTPAQIANLRAFGYWWLTTYPNRDLEKTDFGAAYTQFEQTREVPEARSHKGRAGVG